MNLAEIAEKFVRAAEIDRATHEHVGPAPLRAQQLPYVFDYSDKLGWGKAREARVVKKGRLIQGDWLDEDPLAAERRAFWERVGFMPSAKELADLEVLYDWLLTVDTDEERRALLAWARAKAGGKSFRRWCFGNGIHPNTGRDRKNRALEQIFSRLVRREGQHSGRAQFGMLHSPHQIGHIASTIADDVGERDGLNSWLADGAFSKVFTSENDDFDWARKRNEIRRQREQRRRQAA